MMTRLSAMLCALAAAAGIVAVPAASQEFVEHDVHRHGATYAVSPLASPQPEACQALCEGDSRCMAWSYVRPGVREDHAVCELKSAVTAAAKSPCCDSGIAHRALGLTLAHPVMSTRAVPARVSMAPREPALLGGPSHAPAAIAAPSAFVPTAPPMQPVAPSQPVGPAGPAPQLRVGAGPQAHTEAQADGEAPPAPDQFATRPLEDGVPNYTVMREYRAAPSRLPPPPQAQSDALALR